VILTEVQAPVVVLKLCVAPDTFAAALQHPPNRIAVLALALAS
jgi:hypothetical protein